MAIASTNPATGEKLKEFKAFNDAEIEKRLKRAEHAFQQHRRESFPKRAELLISVATLLDREKHELARTMTLEMGKLFRASVEEIEKCERGCRYYAENAERFLEDEVAQTDARRSYVHYEPMGPILAIMPWNFPFWQVFRFAAPALMAGNTGVLKHASNVPGCALAIEDVFRQAGFPEHAFRTLLIGSRHVNAVIEHPLVRAVTLTGSTPAGKAVASKAGEMLKKTVLELGGSDAYVVLDDADLEATATTCVASRLINAGQSCIAAKRFVVVESIRSQFAEAFVTQMRLARVGDPMEEQTQVGPMARHDLRDELHQQVQASLDKGATCLLGGVVPEGPGAYYPPTVLTNVTKGMPAYDDELFGPVAAIIAVQDEQEAIRVANDSVFGLGAAVFTQDVAKGEHIAAYELEAGCCFVNAFVKSDPRLPFGGIKESGYGRELSSYGIKEFVNIKTVFVR